MTIEDLIGTWDLVSLYGESIEGETWQIYGESPAGMLIYTAERTMSAVLMKHGRPQFTGGLDAPTAEELQEAFFGFDAYWGTYTRSHAKHDYTPCASEQASQLEGE